LAFEYPLVKLNPHRKVFTEMDRTLQISPLRPSTIGVSMYSVMRLFVFLLIWNPIAASAAVPTCVVKLLFTSDEKIDSATDAYVKQVLTGQGYKVIDDSLLTILRRSDYVVKIVMTHTEVPNFGFPVDLMGMQLFIADSSGKILVNSYIDRANLEGDLQASIPACGTSPPSTTVPDSKTDAGPK
jgi:hypothetical protein